MKTAMAAIVAALVLASVSIAAAAELVITPASLTLSLSPGQSGSAIIGAALKNPPQTPFITRFQIRSLGGSLPFAWLTTSAATLTNSTSSLQLPLAISVPVASPAGTYVALLQPIVLSSTIPVQPTARPLMATVIVLPTCSASPTVALDAAESGELWPPDDRLQDVLVSGRIAVPSGCTLKRAWYTVEDEYGELDSSSTDLNAGADGSFTLTVPIRVSRRGNDKDGRTYRIQVSALDETGTGSADRTVTVAHDQRSDK